jgi:death-on-curing protein
MRYVTTTEALFVAARVLDVPVDVLATRHTIQLLESALHSPQATFDGTDLVEGIEMKAATLAFHVSRNHPLPDGNKRLAWMLLNLFLELNGVELVRDQARSVSLMWAVASGEADVNGIRHVISWWTRQKLPATV